MRSPPDARRLALAAALYAAVVVYGSLVPLEFAYRPLADAWYAFTHIRYFQLGVASRADWVANILLYIPLAFFAVGSLVRRAGAAPASLVVFGSCVLLAIGVEFAQLFFPPRTVSLNDLIAETIGTILGIAFWHMEGARLAHLWREVQHGGPQGARALIALYSAAYLTYSLFPYDFLVSATELAAKLGSSGAGLLFNDSCGRALNCSTILLSEVIIVLPLGVFLGMMARADQKPRIAIAFVWGMLLGLVIEVLQIFLASGVSQGMSIMTRGFGMALGLSLYRSLRKEWLVEYRAHLRMVAIATLPLYAVLLLAMIGFFTSNLTNGSLALSKLREVHFMPFYYHYYTSETHAVRSLLLHAGAYAPIGLLVWILREPRSGLWLSAISAFGLSGGVEMLQLFLEGRKPDPTNALIGAAAATLAYASVRALAQASAGSSPGNPRSGMKSSRQRITQGGKAFQ